MNIILCGPSGAGKTTVGKMLATEIGWEWKDTDEIIEKEYGAITQLFKNRGEEYFRALEKQTVKSLERCEKLVISTGGGLVVDNGNACSLKKTGKIVYLRTKKETLLKRLDGSVDRPLLLGENGENNFLERVRARLPVYEAVADFIVDTDGLSIEETAKRVIELLKNNGVKL